jgi:hypothetical protein
MQDTIKQIKELNEKRTQGELSATVWERLDNVVAMQLFLMGKKLYPNECNPGERAVIEFMIASANAIMPLIDAYGESQRLITELKAQIPLDWAVSTFDDKQAELEAAQKKIVELTELLKRVEPSPDTGELYSDITKALYVLGEQTNDA